jgi:membrane-associated phospholipid phosphatase
MTRRTGSASGPERALSLRSLDTAALRLARTRGHTSTLERAALVYSRLGEHAACWFALAAAGAVVDREHRPEWLRGASVVAAAYGCNYAVKLAVRRPRPELADLPPLSPVVSGLSFPSAHATTSFAAVRAFRGLVPAPLLYAAAVLFGISRPYLGVHYPSDVLAGAALGTAIGEGLAR